MSLNYSSKKSLQFHSPQIYLSEDLTFNTLKQRLQPLLDNEINNDFKVL